MQAADVMTHPVITTTADATIEEVAALMLKHRISGLPVTAEDGSVIGMVSEGDLLRRAEIGTENRRPHWLEFIIGPGRLAGEYVRSHARRVADVMTKDVVSITPQTALAEAVALMERRRIKRLPVLESGRIAGILCQADLLRASPWRYARDSRHSRSRKSRDTTPRSSSRRDRSRSPRRAPSVVRAGRGRDCAGC